MKNTKAFFLIILGSFIIATGFAFAETAYEQLEKGFGGDHAPAIQDLPVSAGGAAAPAAAAPAPAAAPAIVPAPPTPTPAPAPSKPIGETIKEFWKDNSRNILLGGIGAFIGFALFGPAGIVVGSLAFVALGML